MEQLTQMGFEQALAELEAVVAQLEDTELSLEEAIALFERGQALLAHCQGQLDAAELKVRQLAVEE
jgi:exodeoxyribonuclease VII small subunit